MRILDLREPAVTANASMRGDNPRGTYLAPHPQAGVHAEYANN